MRANNPQEPPAADDVGAIIARVKEQHTDCSPAGSYRVVCRECDQQWPCDVSQLAAHVEALQAEKDKLRETIRRESSNLMNYANECTGLTTTVLRSAGLRLDAALSLPSTSEGRADGA